MHVLVEKHIHLQIHRTYSKVNIDLLLNAYTFCPSGSNPKIDSFGGEEFGVQLIEAHVAWESQLAQNVTCEPYILFGGRLGL